MPQGMKWLKSAMYIVALRLKMKLLLSVFSASCRFLVQQHLAPKSDNYVP
jgi:hypothetical protein